MEQKPIGFKPYKEYREQFQTELVYTRADLAKAVREVEDRHVINRIVQQGKDYDVALQILAIHKTPEGIMVIVK